MINSVKATKPQSTLWNSRQSFPEISRGEHTTAALPIGIAKELEKLSFKPLHKQKAECSNSLIAISKNLCHKCKKSSSATRSDFWFTCIGGAQGSP